MSLPCSKISTKKTNYNQGLDSEHYCRIGRVDWSVKMNYFQKYGTLCIHSTLEKTCKTQKIFLFIGLGIFLLQRVRSVKTHTLPWIFYTPYNSMSALAFRLHFFFSKYLHKPDIWVNIIFTANLLLFIKDTELVWREHVLERQSLNVTGDRQRRFHT